MIGLLLFLGAGLAISAIVLTGDDHGASEENSQAETLTDGDDNVVGAVYSGGVESYLDDLLAEGELTDAEYSDYVAGITFIGPEANIDGGAGNDSMLGSEYGDTLTGGLGDDYISGGEGDDLIDLGAGNDASGVDERSVSIDDDILAFPYDAGLYANDVLYEAGNDTILGGAGNDAISDNYGANLIDGGAGNDFIIATDDLYNEADTVIGGAGDDILLVDEGDLVTTSAGFDTVTVDLWDGASTGYDVVTVTDFNPDEDVIELEGSSSLLRTPAPSGPDDVVENPITVADTEDGTGAVIYVSGVPVVLVVGGQGMTVANVGIST